MGNETPAVWVGLLALFPLIVLLVTGLYLFALPYVAKWRRGQRSKGSTRGGGNVTAKGTSDGADASEKITEKIQQLGDWRGETLARMRELIHDADPDVVEEWKWMGTPVVVA